MNNEEKYEKITRYYTKVRAIEEKIDFMEFALRQAEENPEIFKNIFGIQFNYFGQPKPTEKIIDCICFDDRDFVCLSPSPSNLFKSWLESLHEYRKALLNDAADLANSLREPSDHD